MERRGRNWPWRKKSSDKSNSKGSFENGTILSDPSHSYDDHDVSRMLAMAESKSDNAVTRWQQAEEKLKEVNEKLISALSDNVLKDNMIKQHSKVAEEAVLGWEKAEAEATAIKLELESFLKQKAATDDQLLHANGALKECMQELRLVKEEKEQKIAEAAMEGTRKWEKARIEFEARLAGLNQQLIEFEAENKVLSRTVQERGRTIIELSDGKSQAEAEVSVLHIRLGAMEKENSTLDYELNILNKELDIRNEERECTKRELEACSRQNLEYAKKIAKLEGEGRTLRALVRRKLPGPAAIAQMKHEVEYMGSEVAESRRRRPSVKSVIPAGNYSLERLQNGNKEMESLIERIQGMEEETKMLREILAQRNSELHAARLLCAKTAAKLSTVEAHLESMSQCSGVSGIKNIGTDATSNSLRFVGSNTAASVVSMSEDSINQDDQVSCADTSASVIVSELAQPKKDEVVLNMKSMLDPSKLKFMDDFTEMEHLASISEHVDTEVADNKEPIHNEHSKEASAGCKDQSQNKEVITDQHLCTKHGCAELRSKLASAEKQVSCLQAKNKTNEATIVSLQEKLDSILAAQTSNKESEIVPEQADVAGDNNRTVAGHSPLLRSYMSQQSEQSTAVDGTQAMMPYAPTEESLVKASSNSQAKLIIDRAISLLETLAHAVGIECQNLSMQYLHEGAKTTVNKLIQQPAEGEACGTPELSSVGEISPTVRLHINARLDEGLKRIALLSSMLLQHEAYFAEFIGELSNILEIIVDSSSNLVAVPVRSEREPHEVCIQGFEVQNVVPAFEVIPSKTDQQQSEIKDIKMINQEKDGDINVKSPVNKRLCVSGSEGETENVHSHTSAVEIAMPEGSNKFSETKEEVSQVKCEKLELEHKLEGANANVDILRNQLKNTEKQVTELQENLLHAQEVKQSDEAVEAVEASRNLTSHVRSGNELGTQLEDKITELQLELQNEQKQHKDALARINDIEEQFRRMMNDKSNVDQASTDAYGPEILQPSPDDHGKIWKDRKIAAATEKLEECQKNILVLGKQLKALASPHESPDRSAHLMYCSPQSMVKQNRNVDPYYSYSAELGSEKELYNVQVHSAQRSNHGRTWSRVNGNQEFEPSWSPPRYAECSPHAQGYAGAEHKSWRGRRQNDVGLYGSDEFRTPEKAGYANEQINTAIDPVDESLYTPAKAPAGYPVVRNRGSSINDLSKAFQAVNVKSPSGKHGGSALSRFFSRSKA